MTNTAALKSVFASIRKEVADGFNPDQESIYSFYRWYVQDAKANGRLAPVAANPAAELRAQLHVAARQAQQFGATEKQINFIVALAIRKGDFNVLSGGLLTKAEASRIIDDMQH